MGRELCEAFPAAREVFDRSRAVLGAEYIDVIFSGPEEKLRETRFTQTSLFIVSMAAHAVAREAGLRADFLAGHSLGEYSALGAAGVFDLETGLGLVKARGEAIGEASARTPGAMAALVGLAREAVEKICAQAAAGGVCQAVNFNCPGQIVIAGTVPAVEEAVRLAQAAGSPKSLRLNVSGPFHSSLMKPAAEKMALALAGASLREAAAPVVMNVDARPRRAPDEIREKLVSQVDHPVLWEDTLRFLIGEGVERFIEIGPGRVLCGLLRRTDRSKEFSNIEDKKSADALIASVAAAH
jgi:[acyl-carrier-protein] S-malonyltransferase